MPPLPDNMLPLLAGATSLLASIAIALLCVACLRRASARNTVQVLVQSECILEHLLQLQTALAATDARVAALLTQFDEHSRRAAAASPASYNVAIRLARSGASRQELMNSCGVTQQEADLVMRLHTRAGEIRQAVA